MELPHKADSSAEGVIATVVPADDLGDVAPESLSLQRWSLRFFAGAAPIATLERAFQARQAKRFRWPVRVVTAIFFVANFALVYYDWSRFVAARGVVAAANGVLCGGSSIGNLITSGQVSEGWPGDGNSTAAQLAAAGDRCSDARAFGAVLTIRLAVMLPLCVAIIGYTFTPWYSRSAQPLALGIWMLGNCLIAYSVVGRNPGYGVLALLILYIFSFTPVNVFISGAVCSTLIVTFGVALGLTRDAWAATVTADASDVGLSVDVQLLNILGVLASFMLIVGFIGHNLEFWLRQSFLDEVRLQVETLRLREERQLSRALLTAMLPEPIIAQLQAGRHLIADTLPEVTVLFAELQFDTHAHPPVTVVAVLNLVYSAFDALIDVHRMHKIETVGHVYLCAGGCPEPSGDHAVCAADMALAMLQALPLVRQAVERETGVPGHSLDLKVGLNSGPCAAGVVGIKNPRYKLVGDTVNTASRMESTCVPGRIQVSQACRDALERSAPGVYVSSPRGVIDVKGKGAMFTYWLHVRSSGSKGGGGSPSPATAAPPAPALAAGAAAATTTPVRVGVESTTAASDDEDDVVPSPTMPTREVRIGLSRDTGASNLTFFASRESGNSRVSVGERMSPASTMDSVDDNEGGQPSERVGASRLTTPPADDSPIPLAHVGAPGRINRDGRASTSGRALTAAALAAADSAAGPYSALELAQAAGHVNVRKRRARGLLATAAGEGHPEGQLPLTASSAAAAAGVASSGANDAPSDSAPSPPPSSGHPPPAASFSSTLMGTLRQGAASLRRIAPAASSAHPRVSSARFQPVLPTLAEHGGVATRPSLARPPIVSGFAPDAHPSTSHTAAATQRSATAAGLQGASSAHWVLAGSEVAASHEHGSATHDVATGGGIAAGARHQRGGADDDLLFVAVDDDDDGDDDDDDDAEEQALAGFFDAVNQERFAVAGIGVAPGRKLSTFPSQRSMVHGVVVSSQPGEQLRHDRLGTSSSSTFEGSATGVAGPSGLGPRGLGEAASSTDEERESFNRMADMINDAIHDTAIALGTSASAVRTPSVFTPQSTRALTEAEGRHASAAITPLAGSFSANRSPLSRPLGRPLDRTRSHALFNSLASPRSPPALPPSAASLRFRSPSGAVATTSAGISVTGGVPLQSTAMTPTTMRSISEDHVVLGPRAGGGRLATVDERLSGVSESSTLRGSDGASAARLSGAESPSPVAGGDALTDGAGAPRSATESQGKTVLVPARSCDSDGCADALPSEEPLAARGAALTPTSTPKKPSLVSPPLLPGPGALLTPAQYGQHKHEHARADHYGGPVAAASSAIAASAHTAKDLEAEIQLAKRHDMLALCLNISSLRGPSAKWERLYQHTMRDSWTAFLRTSVVVGILAIVLFAAQDFVKYRPSSDASAEVNTTKFDVWSTISIARYAVILPSLVFFLATTYTHRFATSWAFSQFTTVLVILTVGGGIIAISVLGRDPGYGVLALYLVYCLNFSLLALALRILALLALVAVYITSALLLGNTGSVTLAEAGLFLMYLAVFTLGESVPVVMREAAVRQNFFRRRRIEIETRKLHTEELRTNKLLANLLPPSIVPRLRGAAHTLIADAFDEVTILWTDMKGFTSFSSTRTPMEVVTFLNAMFSTFDRILDKYGIQKVEVLGDAFFVVGGCPVPSTDHAERCVNAALEMQAHIPILRAFAGGADISMRVGVHTGPVVAGVVGAKDPRYHLFGATVPHANLMESSGEPGRVHISWQTHNRLQVNQEVRARVFVDAVRAMFNASDAVASGVSSHGGDDAADCVTLETQTPASHSVGAYPRVPLTRIDALLREVAAAERQQAAAAAAALEESSSECHESSGGIAAVALLGPAASEVDSGAFDGSRGGSRDAAATLTHAPPSAAEIRARRRRAAGGSARSVDLSVRVAPLQSAEQLVDDSATAEEGVTIVPEEGDGSVRGQVQLWRRGAFLGWDIQTNLVQNDFIYSRSDLPLMLALAPPPAVAATLSAAPTARLRSMSSTGPAGVAAVDAAPSAGVVLGRAGVTAGGAPGAPPLPTATSNGAGRGVSVGGLFSSRSLSAHAQQQCATVTPDERCATAAGAAAMPRTPVNPGDAARRAYRERHKWASVDAAGSSSGDGGLLSGRSAAAQGLHGAAAPAAPGSMLSSRVLLRTMTTIEKAAHGLASRLDYARSEIYRALVGRLRGVRKADEPASLAASDGLPLGPYKPDDPVAVFGPGAGFFAFEERAAPGPGSAPTYFVSRADPPLLPELASAITRLDEFIASAVRATGAS